MGLVEEGTDVLSDSSNKTDPIICCIKKLTATVRPGPSWLRSQLLGAGASSCPVPSPWEECFMGAAENIGGIVKHKDTSALS
jgi:hypothetical protein